MDWLVALFKDGSVAQGLLILSLVVSAGLALGNVRLFKVTLSVGGVLFAGLLAGHLGFQVNAEILEFTREFGLVLFVYAIGLQVGPGIVSSLRAQGLTLNLLAAATVLGGTGITILIVFFGGANLPVALGLLSGAVTNTPSLGAAQQAFKDLKPVIDDAPALLGVGYAVAYPFGILGIILTMHLVKRLFRIDPDKEAEEFERLRTRQVKPILTRNFEVTNPNLAGLKVDRLVELAGTGVVVTRVYRDGKQQVATPETTLQLGDLLHAVGTEARLEGFRVIIGKASEVELPALPSQISFRPIIVTTKEAVGKEIDELELDEKYGVIITRVIRSGVEFSPTKGLQIQFGDRLMAVGEEQALAQASRELGDSMRDLEKPQMIPIFIGIALGVILGTWPIAVIGMPAAVKLGLAGGPLIVAILLSRIGKVGPFIVYMPNAAKSLLREFGICLFLASVGLKAGERLFSILFSQQGIAWVGMAALITIVPLVLVGLVARGIHKLDYVTICGLLAGSMTDPPALAYATETFKNDAPSVAYATVYPLTMLLRVLIAQLFVIVALS
ncbi:MAG: putative transporter [Holophagaceae bacterium]|nr:putative transporter [Holophagaceae bacterium]